MEEPRTPHLLAGKRILRYVKGTLNFGIMFPNDERYTKAKLFGYSDSNECDDKSDQNSTTGYVFMIGKTPISRCSKKQGVVALSSCEAEYIVASMVACQALWLETLLEELNLRESKPIKLLVDKQVNY